MYTSSPLHLDITQRILLAEGPDLCKRFLPEWKLYTSSLMIEALCHTFEVEEDHLCLDVKKVLHESHTEVAVVVDNWLLHTRTTCSQYLTKVINHKSAIDGLFAWLAAVSQGIHLNIIHARGIWTSCRSDITVMTDPMKVYVLRCFVSTPAMHLMDPDKDQSSDPEYVALFRHPAETQEKYITIPHVLNKPVLSIQERLDKTGLQRLSDVAPIQDLLASLLQCSVVDYWQMMVDWIGFAVAHVHMIEKWLVVRELTLSDYLDHLHGGGTSDGCEVWCFSLATDRPVNIVKILDPRRISRKQKDAAVAAQFPPKTCNINCFHCLQNSRYVNSKLHLKILCWNVLVRT